MIKKWQKSSKSKNRKKWKTWKSEKMTKSEKCKNTKMRKCENEKVKKWQKLTPPPKWPKCHLNDQNRHFVKSEPPGPAFFRFQGVPRDPVLRPKMTPPYFWCFLIIFDVFNFIILVILMILRLQHFGEIAIFGKVTFFDMTQLCNVIRPYGNCGDSQERRYYVCVVVLPSFC